MRNCGDTYDSASRLASLTNYISGTAQDVTFTYAGYNPAGQVGSRTRSNDAYAFTLAYNVDRPYTANGLNQLATSGAATLSYDTKGNLTSDGSVTFAYNPENRMASIVLGGYGGFDYDPYGRLLSTTGGVGVGKPRRFRRVSGRGFRPSIVLRCLAQGGVGGTADRNTAMDGRYGSTDRHDAHAATARASTQGGG